MQNYRLYGCSHSDKMSEQNQCKIKHFIEFLENRLQKKVINFTMKQLTKPGDNYGSTIQSVDVEVAEKIDQAEVDC